MGQRSYHVSIGSPAGFVASFEQAAEALERLDRLVFEPDGSFVWTGDRRSAGGAESAPEPTWQVDGVLYDRRGRLAYVEIKGNAPPEKLQRLLAALGWPDIRVTFQLMREGIVLDETAFWAWLDGGKLTG